MPTSRPDLSQLPLPVQAYIESLETEIVRLRAAAGLQVDEPGLAGLAAPAAVPANELSAGEPSLELSEPVTPLYLITLSLGGVIKRTARHLYFRQRRGGMGIFDLAAPEDDFPAHLLVADPSQTLLLITSLGRAFHLALAELPETPIHSRGLHLSHLLPLRPGELPAALLPLQHSGYLALITDRAIVRRLRYHYVAEASTSGVVVCDVKALGAPLAACWTSGEDDCFIATRLGRAIRFPEKLVPVQGAPGIRLETGDAPAALVAVRPDSAVFLLGADGSGTIRKMAGFTANKAPGAGGKIAMDTDRLVAALAVRAGDDLIIISRLSKIIRFSASEVPVKENVVQGVQCMSLRGDETCAATAARPWPNVPSST